MKKISMFCLVFFLLFLTSCSTSNVKVSYDNTNPVKIEEATKGLNLLEILPDPSEVKGTIAVKSIEIDIDDQLDESVLYMIEDNLISSLIDNNYRVVERDPDALTSLYRESSSKYKRKKESNSDNQSDDASELGNLTLNSSGESVINFTISEDGEEIGSITSGTFGPSVNGPIAMGYVKLNFSKPGTKVFLEVRGKKHESKISELPFYKKSYVR